MLGLHDQITQDLEFEVQDSLWDLQLFQHAVPVLSALGGGAVVPKPTTKGERAASAALSSASFGMQVGAATGNVGLGVLGFAGLFAAQALLPSIK